jgi:flagellar biosynthesis protein FlhG
MATTVTNLFSESPAPAPRRAHVIAITGGKGGVGKTSVTANLAISLALRGNRVCIVDADTGLANINILLGLQPRHTLQQFLDEGLPIDELLVEGPRGVQVVPGASGIAEYAELDRLRQQALVNAVAQLEERFDYLLIDTAAGIGRSVVEFVRAASHAIFVVSPDPTSLTDAFALTRVLRRNAFSGALHVLVNMADSPEGAERVYQRFSQAVKKYLHADMATLGFVAADRAVVSSIRLQHPVVLAQPDCAASRCFAGLAMRLDEICAEPPERSFGEHLRAQLPETPVDAAVALLQDPETVQPVAREANLAELNRQFVDCIQGAKGSPEELVAAIKPIIDAFVARFQCFPMDMREAIYRYLEMADLPDQEIRNQVMLLEQLYEKRYQRPLMDKEDNLFRLLNQVRHSEPEFADAISRLQRNYEKQYHPGPQEALGTLVERLRAAGVREDDYVDCIETLRHAFMQTFGREYSMPDVGLRERARQLIGELLEKETTRQGALAVLAAEIEQSGQAQERLQAFLDELE